MGKVLLTIDKESREYQMMKGEVEQLQASDILILRESAGESRSEFADGSIDESWIFSCVDMSPLNLGSAMAHDVPNKPLFIAGHAVGTRWDSLADDANVLEMVPMSELTDRFARRMGGLKRSCDEVSTASEEGIQASDALNDASVLAPPPSRIEAWDEIAQEVFTEVDEPSTFPEILTKREASKKSAFVISVMSGSGGVGKSSIVATASYLAAARGFSVIVIDCDLQFGDMEQMMGGSPNTSIDDMLTDESLFRAFANSCNKDLPALVCAPNRLEKSEELSMHLDEVLDMCATLFDVVFINTGSSWSEVNAQLIEKSSCNIFVVDQRISSIRSCQHAMELCMRMGLATGQFIYALNRCKRGSLFTAIDIANVMNGANVIEVKDGGHEVEELLGLGLAGELAASKNDFTNSLNDMLAEVLP